MIQKMLKVGNSTAITIPKKFLEAIQASENDEVKIVQDTKKKRLIVDFSPQELTEEVIDKEVYTVAKQLLKRYLPAFKELAKK